MIYLVFSIYVLKKTHRASTLQLLHPGQGAFGAIRRVLDGQSQAAEGGESDQINIMFDLRVHIQGFT